MHTVTLYAVLRLLEAERHVSFRRVENLLMHALPMLRGVVTAGSLEQLRKEYMSVAERLANHGCRVEKDRVELTGTCEDYVEKQIRKIIELKRFLAGTPLPFYLAEVERFLPTRPSQQP